MEYSFDENKRGVAENRKKHLQRYSYGKIASEKGLKRERGN